MPRILETSLPPMPPAPLVGMPTIGLAAELSRGMNAPPHLIVTARAGTGKTFTIMVGIAAAFRRRIPSLWDELTRRLGFDPEPSAQQALVWESMALSDNAEEIQVTAFNRMIVKDFETKWSWLIQALRRDGITLKFNTNHSMGRAAVLRHFPRLDVDDDRLQNLICDATATDISTLRKSRFEFLQATTRLVELCKMNLVNGAPHELDAIMRHHAIDIDNEDEVFGLVPRILEMCKDPTYDGCFDCDDMIWLPCVLNLPVVKNDLLLVDECQDLNRCQQALARMAGSRIVMVGDPRQAIYGFAGADAESMPRMERELSATQHGCTVLPLTVTRRCGHAIVREAQKIVPDFEAHPSNPEGVIRYANYPTFQQDGMTVERDWEDCYLSQVRPGDYILCRVNAPLVGNCFRLLKHRIAAQVLGRDIAANLVSTIKGLGVTTTIELAAKVSHWMHRELSKERARRIPNEAKLIAIQDRADCIMCFAEGVDTVAEVIEKIQDLFTDKRTGGVKLASIHKVKGLEADRVFILQPPGSCIPHPMARSKWQIEQEMNLLYVAITRARLEVVFVS